jgi:hypothetical protein
MTNEELYLEHHGIKGMKWGVRRFQNEDGSYTSAGKRRYDIKEAKANLKSAKKEFRQANRTQVKGLMAGRDYQRKVESRERKIQTAQNKIYDAQAALGRAKGGEKGELRAYTKMMRKTGLSGSATDSMNGRQATKLYDHIATKKGKDYAARVEKRAKGQLIGTIAASTAVVVGAQALDLYMQTKRGY